MSLRHAATNRAEGANETMTEVLTAAQMRAIEEAAIASVDVTGLELMERAGRGVVAAIFAEWPELATPDPSAPAAGAAGGSTPSPLRGSPPEYLRQDDKPYRAVVLCGPGNNGGDGFVVARLLKGAGWDVEVFLYGDPEKLPPDARVNYERWTEHGPVPPYRLQRGSYPGSDVLIDALFGIGLTRPIDDPQLWEEFWSIDDVQDVRELRGSRDDQGALPLVRTVAVDLPSGLCANSGRVLGPAPEHGLRAARYDLTVTFHAAKFGHVLAVGPEHCGKLIVKDIGLKSDVRTAAAATTSPLRTGEIGKWFGHKYSHGHAVVLSGGVGQGGAARLAARGALRVGAGAVTLGCPPAALIENAAQLNAVMLRKVKDADKLAEILGDDRINALCLGPGLGTGARESALLAVALGRAGGEPRPTVLDADALTLLAQDGALFSMLHAHCVLTPHAGEFKRLFPDIAAKLDAPATTGPAYSKVDATRQAAARAGCVVLFKGPDTVIAAPSGRCSINASVYERTAPWLATAGAGDVLAGIITGLLARGFTPMRAAETGAWLHSECALHFGPGLIAEDLPEQLPAVFRALGI